VPIAGKDAVPNGASRQRVAHVGALVISGVYPAIDVEKRDRASLLEFYGFSFAWRDFIQACNSYPFGDRFDHGSYS